MSPALITMALWVIAGALAAALPSKHNHWPTAWALTATGLPILLWVWLSEPWGVALLATAATASVLRWPIRRVLGLYRPKG